LLIIGAPFYKWLEQVFPRIWRKLVSRGLIPLSVVCPPLSSPLSLVVKVAKATRGCIVTLTFREPVWAKIKFFTGGDRLPPVDHQKKKVI